MEKKKLEKDGAAFPVPFYQIHYPLSAFSESLRTLRSGILMLDVDHPPKSSKSHPHALVKASQRLR